MSVTNEKPTRISLLVDEDINLYAVADGMGGHSGGEVASALAVETLHNFLKEAVQQTNFSPDSHLVDAFQTANIHVFNKSQENDMELVGMGTTLVVCMVWKTGLFLAMWGIPRPICSETPIFGESQRIILCSTIN